MEAWVRKELPSKDRQTDNDVWCALQCLLPFGLAVQSTCFPDVKTEAHRHETILPRAGSWMSGGLASLKPPFSGITLLPG